MSEPEAVIMVRVTPALRQKAKIKAALLGVTVSDLVRECLTQLTKDVVLPVPDTPEEAKKD